MATTIKLKNGSGAPLAGDLVQGEPALDLTNKRLYTEDSGGTVIEVGTNPSTLTVDTTTLVVDATNNRVGIGTTSPDEPLTIETPGAGLTSTINLRNTESSDNPRGGTIVYNVNNGSTQTNAVFLQGFKAGNTSGGIFTISTANSSWSAPAERMRIDSSGNVGIGTTNPTTYANQTNLNINSGSVSRIDFDISDSLQGFALAESGYVGLFANTGNYLALGANNAEHMRIDSSGNVGIGTTSPSTKLDIIGSTTNGSGVVDTLRLRNTGTTLNDGPRIQFTAGASTSGAAIGSQGKALNSADLLFYAGGNTERMRIDSSGRVGIGNTNPSYKLEVSGPGSVLARLSATDSSQAYMAFTNSTTGGGIFADGIIVGLDSDESAVFYNFEATPMRFGTSGAERMRITSNGNVGIGTTNPSALFKTLNIDGGALGSSIALDGGSNFAVIYTGSVTNDPTSLFSNTGFKFATATAKDATGFSEAMRIDSSGNVLVGTTTVAGTGAGVRLGSSGYGYFSRVNNTPLFCYNATTTTSAPIAEFNSNVGGTNTTVYQIRADGTVYSASDERLKTNIADAENSSSVLDAIKVRQFDWKESEGHVPFGLIAQELNEALPSCVSAPSTDEGTWAVDYTSIIPLLIKEIQDLRARVAQLEGA